MGTSRVSAGFSPRAVQATRTNGVKAAPDDRQKLVVLHGIDPVSRVIVAAVPTAAARAALRSR